jgi:hypothetical protein
MRIIVDKVDAPPPHALNRRDVKALLSVLPKDWDFPLPIVHLRATLAPHFDANHPVRYDYLAGPKLSICSRGLSLQTVYRHVLRELAIQGLHKSTRYGHQLSQSEMEEIDKFIQPLLEQMEMSLSDQKPPARETQKHNEIYQRLEAIGYTWREAYEVLRTVEDEQRNPTSRTRANRVNRARQVLLEAGIDPHTLELMPQI